MLAQVGTLAAALHGAAVTHHTVGLAAHAGASKADASVLDGQAAPLKAIAASLAGVVDRQGMPADAAASEDLTLPHVTNPLIALTAKDGLGAVAGQSMQLANGETVLLASGRDTQFASGGQMRVHTGQAIGVLGGAVTPGEGGIGLQLLAAKDAVDIQAQSDVLKVQARDEVNVMSAHAHIDWAAAKWISLSTAGGANIRIEGGNITVQCPGKIAVHAGKKEFSRAANAQFAIPVLPREAMRFDEKFQLLDPAGDPVRNVRYSITKENGGKVEGVTNENGEIPLQQGFSPDKLVITILGRV